MQFLGLMRVKDEVPYIRLSLASQMFCDRIIVLDDHSTDETPRHCCQFENVRVIDSPFDGCNEGRDREFLAEIARQLHPEWVVTLDGDEVLEADAWDKIRAVANDPSLQIIDVLSRELWDSDRIERIDGHFGASYRQRIWRLPEGRLTYQPNDCALPDQLDGVRPFTDIGVSLWHYGSINAEKRRQRYEAAKARGHAGPGVEAMIQGDPGGLNKRPRLVPVIR